MHRAGLIRLTRSLHLHAGRPVTSSVEHHGVAFNCSPRILVKFAVARDYWVKFVSGSLFLNSSPARPAFK